MKKAFILLLVFLLMWPAICAAQFRIVVEQKQGDGSFLIIKAVNEKDKDVTKLLTKDAKTKKYIWPSDATIKAAEKEKEEKP